MEAPVKKAQKDTNQSLVSITLTSRICTGLEEVKLIRDGKAEAYTVDELLCELPDVSYDEPNEINQAAIAEAHSGKLRNMPSVDTSSVEAMFKSVGL